MITNPYMNTMNDKIKAKIIELVPEIRNWAVGSIVENKELGKQYLILERSLVSRLSVYVFTIHRNDEGLLAMNEYELARKYRILGRPITLADVLRAMSIEIGKKVGRFDLKWNNDFAYFVEFSNTEDSKFVAEWNLFLGYDDQTQETKDFIGKLIGV